MVLISVASSPGGFYVRLNELHRLKSITEAVVFIY